MTWMKGFPAWRLILDPPGEPSWNMAVDEALLRGQAESADAPTLRFYSWSSSALSLGRFQPSLSPEAIQVCRKNKIQLVRRPTGGGGVLHSDEVTYSISAALGKEPFPRSVTGIYRKIRMALKRGLGLLGVEVDPNREDDHVSTSVRAAHCFTRIGRWEICCRSRKLVGSAQGRFRNRFLQHGSIPLRWDKNLFYQAFGMTGKGKESWEFPATSLEESLEKIPPRSIILNRLIQGFAAEFGVSFRRYELNEAEKEQARAIQSLRGTDPVPGPLWRQAL